MSARIFPSSARAASTDFSPVSSASRRISSASRRALFFISSTRRWVVTSVSCRVRSRSVTPRALLLGRNLLLEQRRLLEQRLVVLGHVVEEGVDLLGVVALEHLRRELLLSDVVWGDAHRGLPPYPRLPASW